MKSALNYALLSPVALRSVNESLLVLKCVPHGETNKTRIMEEIRNVERVLLEAVRSAGREFEEETARQPGRWTEPGECSNRHCR